MFIRKIRAVKVISPDFGSLFDEQGKKENYKKKKGFVSKLACIKPNKNSTPQGIEFR